jgi:hypothetical protein
MGEPDSGARRARSEFGKSRATDQFKGHPQSATVCVRRPAFLSTSSSKARRIVLVGLRKVQLYGAIPARLVSQRREAGGYESTAG